MAKTPPRPVPPKPCDVFLREMGFSIHSRPETGQPMWERQGKVVTQEHAHKLALAERQRMLKQLESL